MARTVEQELRDAARAPGQGDLFAHAVQQQVNEVTIEYPSAFIHARANMTSVLAGIRVPLAALKEKADDAMVIAGQLPLRSQSKIRDLALAARVSADPLGFEKENNTMDNPAQLDLPL